MVFLKRLDFLRRTLPRLCDLLALAACTCCLYGIVGGTAEIALGQSTSAHSCTPAFTGRVGPPRPSQCQRRARPTAGPRGRQGHSGVRGPTGFAGLPGPSGPEGPQGPLGATGPAGVAGAAGLIGHEGATGSTGATGLTGNEGPPGPAGLIGLTGATGLMGLPGLPGASGTTGPAGETGLQGVAGFEGQAGPKGEVGAAGIAGPAGPKGEVGAAGIAGPIGPKGEAGVPGSSGPKGETGAEGPPGPVGPAGATGAAGPEGSSGSPVYAEFYALMPPDNAATVAAGAPVSFPRTGSIAGGIVRLDQGEFVLPRIGTYSVDFSVSVTEPGQLVVALDSGGGMVEVPYTVYGRATGTSQIVGDALITTTVANSTVELRNPTGNTPALTITPLAGGTHPAVASMVIQRLG